MLTCKRVPGNHLLVRYRSCVAAHAGPMSQDHPQKDERGQGTAIARLLGPSRFGYRCVDGE